jgi:mRNA interferase HicA
VKRRDLERHLIFHGCFLHHHGGCHDVWVNAHTLKQSSVPRHNELKFGTARGICRILGIPPPEA